jgi:hypothetical protein
MGFFAGAVDGDDSHPIEDFSMPPAAGTPTGSLTGIVMDDTTHAPLAGAVVAFGGHASGFAGDYAAITDATGHYTISGIFAGTYPDVFASSAGYDKQVTTMSVASRVNTRDWALRRDFAALGGGSKIVDFSPPDFSAFGCGPSAAVDQSQGSGWGSTSDLGGPKLNEPTVKTPKHVTVQLPTAVNISQLTVDPSNTCGDGGSASTKDFSVETSTNGVNFVSAATGTFGPTNRAKFNTVPLTAGTTGVKFVRFTMKSPQLPDGTDCTVGGFSGCDFMDMSEMEVYGAPATP